MTPGQLLYQVYHRPIGRIRQCIRNGGPWIERETERYRLEMVSAAERCSELPRFDGDPVKLHLMTGLRFWYQTVFCLHSFCHVARKSVHVELYDDGSIDEVCAERLLRLGHAVTIHRYSDLRAKLESMLPSARFPHLHERWRNYPNLRKLIDVHLGGRGWQLVLDSDLLFFREPREILDWLAQPASLLHAIDCQECYGYSRPLLERLAGAPLPERVNVGICGLRSDTLDWERIERWIAELHRAEGTNYYLEQALVAMLAARTPHQSLSPTDYVTLPARSEVEEPRAVMHHYVDTSKRWYYRYGWRHVLTAQH